MSGRDRATNTTANMKATNTSADTKTKTRTSEERAMTATKTYVVKASEIQREWRVVDADGATLGRLATQVASLLLGKHRAMQSPGLDTGDPVIIVNAAKIKVTGNKLQDKMYVRHSGYPGGFRAENLE